MFNQLSATEIDCLIEGMFTLKTTVPFSFDDGVELYTTDFFCVPYSYGILKIMVVVKFIRAISVLRPSEAIFSLRALKKKMKVFSSFCVTFIANILI